MWSNSEELFLLTDNLAGGKVQIFKRRLKFGLRQIIFKSALFEIFKFFENKSLLGLFEIDPSLYLKCTRSYLWVDLGGKERARAQLSFFDWLLSRFSLDYIHHFYRSEQANIINFTHADSNFQIMLSPSRGLGREGELMVSLYLNGSELMKASVSVLPSDMLGAHDGKNVLFIGCFQGTSNTKDLMKQATQALERTKPSFFLLNALQAMAQAWGLAGMVGVADKKHVYANYFSLSKRISISYDDVWQQLGATEQTAQGHWLLPLVWEPRPEHEVESKKRSALKRRNALRQRFIDECVLGFQQLGKSLN